MKLLGWVAIGALTALCAPAMAQQAPEIAQGWRKVDGPAAGYVNAATLMRCPETLSGGYAMVSTQVYEASIDVSCAYRRSADGSVISFNWYPARSTAQDELTASSRVLLARVAPGVTPKEGQRSWTIAGVVTQVSTLEAIGSDGYGQSFAMTDIAGRRMKARETWSGDGAISHGVADSFFALQQDAIANAQACLAMPAWPTTRKARLSGDPFTASMSAAIVLQAMAPLSDQVSSIASPKPCILANLGQSNRGASILLSRDGPTGIQLALDDQPKGDLLAGLASIKFGAQLNLPGDAQYALYSKKGQTLSIYRSYRVLPNWEQILADMVLVASNELPPLVVMEPEVGETKAAMKLNPDESEKEKRRQRPGSR